MIRLLRKFPGRHHSRSLVYRAALAGWGPLSLLRLGQHSGASHAHPATLPLPNLAANTSLCALAPCYRTRTWASRPRCSPCTDRHPPERHLQRPVRQAARYHAENRLASRPPDSGNLGERTSCGLPARSKSMRRSWAAWRRTSTGARSSTLGPGRSVRALSWASRTKHCGQLIGEPVSPMLGGFRFFRPVVEHQHL